MGVTWDSPEEERCFLRAIDDLTSEPIVSVTPERISSFLAATRSIQLPEAERLRRLAIKLEAEEFEDGWQGLRRIYAAAAEAAPENARVYHSWGISAIGWMDASRTPGLPEQALIAREGEDVLSRASALHPGDSDIAHAMGLLFYNHPLRGEDKWTYARAALEWFQRASEWDPSNVIARLYLAHCHHDLMDWLPALKSYEGVDLDRLAREWAPWRALKCKEQMAACHAKLGFADEAIRRFTALLDEIAPLDEEALTEDVVNLDELVDAVTRDLRDSELLRRTRAAVNRLEFGKRYPRLFEE